MRLGPSAKRIGVVDLVRTVAVLAVLGGHLGIIYLAVPSASPFLHAVWYKFCMLLKKVAVEIKEYACILSAEGGASWTTSG